MSSYNLFLIDGFDDFLGMIFSDREDVHVIWTLKRERREDKVYAGIPRGIHHVQIPLFLFKNSIEQFKESLQE